MAKRKLAATNTKIESLRQQGLFNTHFQDVSDTLFQEHRFFCPHDLVQVKYEMLRRVQVDGQPISQAAAAFGFSRPSFYQAQASFQQAGFAGLIPQKPGPRRPHKLTQEVLAFISQEKTAQEDLTPTQLVKLIREKFGIIVHPRTIERKVVGRAKKQ